MKYSNLLLITTFLAINIQAQDISFDSVTSSITQQELTNHVYTLASDTMKGRDTGEDGQKMAAQYISNYFTENQLMSLTDSIPYHQFFNLYTYDLGKSKLQFIKETPDSNTGIQVSDVFFASNNIHTNDTIECIFIGYGNENDLKGLTLENKAAAILFESTEITLKKCSDLKKKHQIEVFYILTGTGAAMPYSFEKYSWNTAFKNSQFYWMFDFLTNKFSEESFHYREKLLNDIKKSFEGSDSLNVFFVTGWVASAFKMKYKQLKKMSESNKTATYNMLAAISPIKTYYNIDFKYPMLDTIETENIIAYVPGNDLKSECIVVTAHYDHVGVKDTGICYGADDNASGTAAVMEIAEAFALANQQGYNTKRSVLFIAFSGEELGLRGAYHYVNHPLVSLDSTVLNVNIDMIGRNKKDKEKYANKVFPMIIDGRKHYIKATLRKENKSLAMDLKTDFTPGLKERFVWKSSSDHYHFHKNEIPLLILFTGLHPDYHTPADTPDKINYSKLTEISRLTFNTIWELANSDKMELPDTEKIDKKDKLMDKFMR